MQQTGDQPMTDQTTDRRVTVPEAAVLLGLSEDAVRSRLKRGTLRKEKGMDGTVYVVFGSSESTDRSTTNQAANGQPTTSQPTDQSSLVEVLQDQVLYLREQLREEREANRENRRIIAGLVQRVPELELVQEPSSSTEPQESPTAPTEEGNGTQPPSEPEKRSWWRRFFGFE